MEATEIEITTYKKHQNLKLAANELGVKWQTLYVHLKESGVAIVGNKAKYGSETDKTAAKGERLFKRIVPFSQDQNEIEFQAKIDFLVKGYAVDIKTSKIQKAAKRWSFSVKKQEMIADFMVCIALGDHEDAHILLIPGEICRYMQTINLNLSKTGKWWDFQVSESELKEFFDEIPFKGASHD